MRKISILGFLVIGCVLMLSGCAKDNPLPEITDTPAPIEEYIPETNTNKSSEYITENLKMVYDINIGLDVKIYYNDENSFPSFSIIDPTGKEYLYSDDEHNDILGLYLGANYIGCNITDTQKGLYKIKYQDLGDDFVYDVEYIEPVVYLDVSEPTIEGLSFTIHGLKSISGTWSIDAVNMNSVTMTVVNDNTDLPLQPVVNPEAEFISLATGAVDNDAVSVSYNADEVLAPGSYILFVNLNYTLNSASKLAFLEVGPIDIPEPIIDDIAVPEVAENVE